jgi:PmbA protein
LSSTATVPLAEVAQDVVRLALEAGATDAECTIVEGDEFSASVRMRQIENLKEAGSRAAGLRVVIGKRTGSSYTSDLTVDGIARMVRSAVDLAAFTTEDPHCGLPADSEFGSYAGDLALYCDDVRALDTPSKIDRAKQAEAAALAYDPRISNSEGASFDTNLGRHVFANSRGFSGEYRTSHCSLVAVPLAVEGDSMERDYWFTMSRSAGGMESPEVVGRTAAERAVRRLGSRKVETQKATIVFEPRTARALLSTLFEAVSGDSIYRHASFLAGKLGEKIASDKLTIIDDGTIPGLFGSSPFDDEGVPARRTVVVDKGVLRSYLLNTYTARKLGLKTTGSASRGLTGNTGVGHANFFVEAGDRSPSEIIAGIRNGFYVTELMGFGTNVVSGDYSQGAAGIWIRDGELAFPVSEVTIAGNLRSMLESIEAIGSDLEFRSSVASPTIAIQEMTVAGR